MTSYVVGTNKEKFVSFLKEELLPTLSPGKVLVMDNLRAHHAKEVKEVIVASHCFLLYLPPYCPQDNPIELGWSKGKLLVKSQEARTYENLTQAWEQARLSISETDALHFFAHCGYS